MSLPTRRSTAACTAFNRLSPSCTLANYKRRRRERTRRTKRRRKKSCRSAVPFIYNWPARNLLLTNSFAFIVKILMVLYIRFFALIFLYCTRD